MLGYDDGVSICKTLGQRLPIARSYCIVYMTYWSTCRSLQRQQWWSQWKCKKMLTCVCMIPRCWLLTIGKKCSSLNKLILEKDWFQLSNVTLGGVQQVRSRAHWGFWGSSHTGGGRCAWGYWRLWQCWCTAEIRPYENPRALQGRTVFNRYLGIGRSNQKN